MAIILKNLNVCRGVIARNPLNLKELENIVKCEELAWKATQNTSNFLMFHF